jgi:hypothetical protein
MRDRPARAPASLEVWIEGLRDRLAGGGLAHLGPIELGDGCTFPTVELAVRIMLADLEHVEDLPRAEREHPRTLARRRRLLDDFATLRGRIG